jgi:Uncharacterized low-complexity proteins
MDRFEVIKKFRADEEEVVKKYREKFSNQLFLNLDKLHLCVTDKFNELNVIIEKTSKENVSYIYFSFMRIDALEKNYNILVHVQDFKWYFDNEPIWINLDMNFFYSPINDLWDYLLNKSKRYFNKISKYDIRNMIFEELNYYNSLISEALRQIFHITLYESEVIEKIPHNDYLVIRWGEYRDKSELLLQIDKIEKNFKDWKKEIKAAKGELDRMVFSSWNSLELNNSKCKDKNMAFITFEKAKLENCIFEGCNMSKARFVETVLKDCQFINCIFTDADFAEADFENCSFEKSNMLDTIFSEKNIKKLELSEKQRENIKLKLN